MTNPKDFFENLAGGGEQVYADSDEEQKEVELAEASSPAEDLSDEREGQLTIDVYQTPEAIIVESPVAGVDPEDLEINVTSEAVTIRGRRERESEVKEQDYFYQECYWGRFSRSVILPQEIDPDKAEANIKNGVLTLKLPKISRRKERKLKVKSS